MNGTCDMTDASMNVSRVSNNVPSDNLSANMRHSNVLRQLFPVGTLVRRYDSWRDKFQKGHSLLKSYSISVTLSPLRFSSFFSLRQSGRIKTFLRVGCIVDLGDLLS